MTDLVLVALISPGAALLTALATQFQGGPTDAT